MLKVPTYVIGSLLFLTGLLGYLVQDPGLTLKLKGPLANNAKFVLSDGAQTHEMDFIPCPESAGENVWWLAHKLNEDHARVASQKNFATENGANDNDLQSFWYASSRGETMKGLLLESERYNNAGTGESISIDWTKIDINSSSLRIIYKNAADNPGPVTLTSNNWENVDLDPLPNPGDEISFSKSWTAFIPGIIGLILVILARLADVFSNGRKHIMHLAVLFGLLGFFVSAGKIGSAVAEMNWLKGEPYGIIHASMLKPLSMLLTSGLLFIFIILCVVSFISARKEMAAQAKAEEERKKNVLKKVKAKNDEASVKSESIEDEKSDPKDDKADSKEEDKKDNSSKYDIDDAKPSSSEDEKDDSLNVKDTPKKTEGISDENENVSEDKEDSKSEVDQPSRTENEKDKVTVSPSEETKDFPKENESNEKSSDSEDTPEMASEITSTENLITDSDQDSANLEPSGSKENNSDKDSKEEENSSFSEKDDAVTDSDTADQKDEEPKEPSQNTKELDSEKTKE